MLHFRVIYQTLCCDNFVSVFFKRRFKPTTNIVQYAKAWIRINSASHPDPSCWHSDEMFTNLSDIEALWKWKQTRNLADDNLFCGISTHLVSVYFLRSHQSQPWSKNLENLPEGDEYLPLAVVIMTNVNRRYPLFSGRHRKIFERIQCLPIFA